MRAASVGALLLLAGGVQARCRTLHHQGRRILSFGCDPDNHGLTRRMLADLNRSSSQEMLIGTKSSPPFSFVPDDPVDRSDMRYPYTGFSWDLFEDWIFPVAQANGLNYTSFRVVPYVSNTQILQAVANGEIEMGHAAITKTPQREEFVDFSTGWYDTGLSVMARANDADIATQALNTVQGTGRIFFNLLALMAIAVAMMAVVLFTLERTSPGSRPVIRKGCCTGLKDSGVLIMLLLAGVDIRLPSGRCSRPAGALCSMCSGLLAIMVTAMSTVVLQSASNTFSIQSFADLSGNTVIAVGGTTGERYVVANGINVDVSPATTVEDMFSRFENGEGDALFYDKPILSAFIARDTAAMGTERFALRGQIHLQQQYGIAMAPSLGIEAKEAVDRAILSFYGSDEFKVLEARWLGVELETSGTPSADPASITRFLEDYFWLIAMGGGAIIGLALLVGLVGLVVRYQMSQVGDGEAKKKSTVVRLFGCCFGKDQERGQATDKIAALKRSRRASMANTSGMQSGEVADASPSGAAHSIRGAAAVTLPDVPVAADHASSSCCSCFGGSASGPRRSSTRVTPTSGSAKSPGVGAVGGRAAPRGLSEELAAQDAKKSGSVWAQGLSQENSRKLAWSQAEGGAPVHGSSAHLSDILGVAGGSNGADSMSMTPDVTGLEDDGFAATGLASSPRLATSNRAAGPPGRSLSAGRLDKRDDASGEEADNDSQPLLDPDAGSQRFMFGNTVSKSESAGPTASDAVARAFGGIAGGVFSKGGGDASTTGGSSVKHGSSHNSATPATGTLGARFGGNDFASGQSGMPPPLLTRLETSPLPITAGLIPAETPRTLKVYQAQADQAIEAQKTLSRTASGVEAALANMSFRLPRPGEKPSGPHGGLAAKAGAGAGGGGLGVPAGASLEMDADERLFLKREQWRLRYASRLAPILPPNDLIWMIYERVDILTQQALLQRAMGRLDVPADLEEISPTDLTKDAEEIRLFLVSKGVAPRTASSLAVLVAMGGTMNDHDAEDDETSLTTVRKNHRVLGGAGADTIVAADKSSKARTRPEMKSQAGSTALRKMQLRAKMASALVSHPSRANVLGKPPQFKTAVKAKQAYVPPMGHRSSSVGPVPKRSGSKTHMVGTGGRTARVGRATTRKPHGESTTSMSGSAGAAAAAASKTGRSRSRKQRGEKRSGRSGRTKPKRKPDAAKP